MTKSRFIKIGLCVVVFLLLVGASNLLLMPVYDRVGGDFRNLLLSLNRKAEEEIGLVFSYESLSPSILGSVNLNNISVVDARSQKSVIKVRRLSLSYSILDLLNGRFYSALKSLSLRDVEIDLLDGENDFWLKKISGGKDSKGLDFSSLDNIFAGFDFSFLDAVRVYRLHGRYRNSRLSLDANVKKANFLGNRQGGVDASVLGNFNLAFAGQNVSGGLDFSTTLPKGVSGGSAVLRFTDVSALGYRVRYLGFLADYKNRVFNLSMLPGSQNVFVYASMSLESGDMHAEVRADGFNISRLVRAPKRTEMVDSLFAMNFSLDANADYNMKSGVLSYSSKGDVFVPAGAIPAKKFADDILVSYSVSGDEKKIEVPYFRTTGERYNLSFEGGFDFVNLQPEGNLYVESFVLPNGGEFSSELYIEPQERGFMCFSPQLRFGEQTLTAAQIYVIPTDDSWDVTFEVSDYSHPDSEMPGMFSFYGSYGHASKEFQASASINTIYIDTVVSLAAFFADEGARPMLSRAATSARPYVFSCDAFASGQGGEFSFNVPYAFAANTVREDQMLIFAAAGNREGLRLSDFDLAFAGQHVSAEVDSQFFVEQKEVAMNGRLELNGMPYSFSGLLGDGWASVSADYGFTLSLNADKAGFVTGIFSVEDLPVTVSERTFSLTNDSAFSYSVEDGLLLDIRRFEGRMLGDSYLSPAIAFSASVNSQGIIFESLSYSDTVSTLSGGGDMFWVGNLKNFEGVNFSFELANPAGIERVALSGSVSNPLGADMLAREDLLDNLFVSANLNVDSLRSQRFVRNSREADSMNAELSVQGSLGNPFVKISVPSAVFAVQDKSVALRAEAVLENKVFLAHDVSLDMGRVQVKNLEISFDISKWLGDMSFDFEATMLKKKFSSKIFATAQSLSDTKSFVPEVMEISLDTAAILENGIKKYGAIHLGITKMQDDFIISSNENLGISGTYSDYKNVSLKMSNSWPMSMVAEGVVSRDELNLVFSNIRADLAKIFKSLDLDLMKMYRGNLSGGFAIIGTARDPYFTGRLDVANAEFNFPQFFTRHAVTDKVSLIMSGSEFYTEPTRCTLRRAPVDVTVNVQMNRFAFENLDVRVRIVGNTFAPLNINYPEIHIKGNVIGDVGITYDGVTVGVSGEVTAKDANAEFGVTRINEIIGGLIPKLKSKTEDSLYSPPVDISLKVTALSRVQISYSSFLRAVVVPGSEIGVSYFSDTERLLLDGDVPIRSGEISYLNSNFYIKSGSIHFSENDESFDPRITVTAETKTHDDNNDNVTITLLVDNQRLSSLTPRLTASPAKSEREIMEILGNIITAESSNAANFALATGDYALQMVFTRKLENALRDLLKFDIFSVRTMVVQNVLKQGIEQTSFSNPAGNYFDNTTVYIGKYLDNSIFADAMLRLDYDENRVGDKYTVNGLSFRPEIGFELDSPFVNVRWSMSPDFEDLVNLRLVQNTALTLSWKFDF